MSSEPNAGMSEFVELSVTVDGTTLPVRCALPSTLKSSFGPMSIRSALEPATLRLLDRMVEILDINLNKI